MYANLVNGYGFRRISAGILHESDYSLRIDHRGHRV
jgi:hypothetical protein